MPPQSGQRAKTERKLCPWLVPMLQCRSSECGNCAIGKLLSQDPGDHRVPLGIGMTINRKVSLLGVWYGAIIRQDVYIGSPVARDDSTQFLASAVGIVTRRPLTPGDHGCLNAIWNQHNHHGHTRGLGSRRSEEHTSELQS